MKKTAYDVIDALKSLSGLGVCLYDLQWYFTEYPNSLDWQYHGHYCDYCIAVKKLPGGQSACNASDFEKATQLSKQYGRPFLNVCHAGVCEYIVPIFHGKNLLGMLFIGQCVISGEVDFKRAAEGSIVLRYDSGTLEKLFHSLPYVSREKLTSLGKLADLSFKTLANLPEFSITYEFSGVSGLAKNYIDHNYMNDISLTIISEKLHTNPSYLSRAFKERFNINFSEYIANVRIEQAKSLLMYTDVPITHIAFNVGFSDPNYFSRIFKKTVGQSPRTFRKEKGKYLDL